MADCKLKHRQLLYAVSTRLSQEDVKDMMYLAGIEHQLRETINSGTDLFTVLEQKGLLDEQNHSYLISLLETIGRIDLIKTVLNHPNTVILTSPEKRDCFTISGQLAIIKRSQILGKKELYTQSIQKLEAVFKCTTARQQRFEEFFFQTLSLLQFTEFDPSYMAQGHFTRQRVCNFLKSQSLFWKIWPETLAQFQQTGSNGEAECLVSLCHQNYKEFCTQLPKDYAPLIDDLEIIQFKVDRRDHVIGKIAQHSQQVLKEILTELLGHKKLLTVAGASFNEAMFTIESMSYCSQHLLPFTRSLLILTHAVQVGHIDLKRDRDIILLLASNHREGIVSRCDEIAKILGQDSLDELLAHIPTTNQSLKATIRSDTAMTIHSTLISTINFIWHTCLVILVHSTLPNNPQMECSCFESVLADLLKVLIDDKEKLRNVYVLNSKKMGASMLNELQKYRSRSEQLILELTGGSRQSADIIRTIFR